MKPDMKAFRFKGGDEYMTYSETCKKAKQDGIVAVEKPSEEQLRQVQAALNRMAPIYSQLIVDTAENGQKAPLRLRGLFIYDESKQSADLRGTFGVSVPLDNGSDAIIGLSMTLLDLNTPSFTAYVLGHEMCHLCSDSGHGEAFQSFLNEMTRLFFMQNVRMDAAGARLKNLVKGWKM